MPAASFIERFIPHAPKYGLYVRPNIPADKLSSALNAYARKTSEQKVVALYDATLLNSARDGAIFTTDEVVFRNNQFEPPQHFGYDDVVGVRSRRRLLGGRRLEVDVNRGQAVISVDIDFSGKSDATEYVERLLKEAMLHGIPAAGGGATDIGMVDKTLRDLVRQGDLSHADYERLMRELKGGG